MLSSKLPKKNPTAQGSGLPSYSASVAFILWVFFFIGFTIRHLVVYSRAAREDS
jgi:hypothetical protein